MRKQTYKLMMESVELLLIILSIFIIAVFFNWLFSHSERNAQERIDNDQIAEMVSYHQEQGHEIIVFE